MAEDHGIIDDKIANTAVRKIVHVRATDTRLLHSDEHLMIADYHNEDR